jgi:hypothetical protein
MSAAVSSNPMGYTGPIRSAKFPTGVTEIMTRFVMYKVGMHYERDDLLDILLAYERVYLIDVSCNVPLEEIKSKYRAGLGMMKYVDEITRLSGSLKPGTLPRGRLGHLVP